ncbi:MAG: RNA polymerase factor sigma-54 [Kiloniellales bacterium]|nr:RNA polymerase factor sigma-54 [Kiloniellales bacterium]
MAATQRLELRQSQSLVMTPQLQQAIKLLQLTNLELAAQVDRELELNPLLERDDGEEQSTEPLPGDRGGEDFVLPEETPASNDSLDDMARPAGADFVNDAPLDTNFENLYNHDSQTDSPSSAINDGMSSHGMTTSAGSLPRDDDNGFEQRLSRAPTLREHLLYQLQIAFDDSADKLIALHIVDMLDPAGYICGDLTDLAERLSCPMTRIEDALSLLQGFEPTGVFARNLKECLALQLAELNRLDPAMQTLLDHLDLLAKGELSSLRRLCGVDSEDFSDMLAEVRALNPKPALHFEPETNEIIVPDVLMRALANGNWLIELNSETLPRVIVNHAYYAEVSKQARSRNEREYLSTHLQQANWLVKALHQRATTILKVSREIVRQQDGFFRKGIQHLRPLTLKDIAQAVDLHESTVSRVTANKYIATPRGIFELKYFFTAAIAGVNGTLHSAEAIRHRIKLLIDNESARKVLSDDTIVEILRSEGVDIARRTVAKYREAMKIPSSVQRRREKAMSA